MSRKIGYTILAWVMVIFVEIIIAAMMPALTGISGSAAAALVAGSDMSNYPGTLPMVQAFPVYVWFIAPAAGFVATAVFLKTDVLT